MRTFFKDYRIQLSPEPYDRLRMIVLRRDGWHCQHCGSSTNLEVHHLQFRSHSGQDVGENLITLCHHCHGLSHR
jgi:5-methylcytosine-specific restriction endonuclease McrA